MKTPPLVVPADRRAPALDVVGTKVTVLADRAATGGSEVTEQEGPEGTGPPPHARGWDESFFVLEGEVEFGIGEETVTCGPGTFVHVPGGTVHAFRYGTGGGRLLEFTGASSHATKLFADLDAELAPGPPEVAKVAEIFGRHGARLG